MKPELMKAIEADHIRAMEYVDRAHEAQRCGDTAAVSQHFIEAFLLEKQAAEAMVPYLEAEPTRSILLRSAALLALNAQMEADAAAGKFDVLVAEALAEYRASKATEI